MDNMSILKLLDEKLEGFKQIKNTYPKKIIVSQEVKDKIFDELKEYTLDLSWVDKQNNYRGILLEIKKDVFIELN